MRETMMNMNILIKNGWIVLLPAILSGFLAFQAMRCGNILDRRNAYLLENLPISTDLEWDFMSGNVYPFLYIKDDQPGGIARSRSNFHRLSNSANAGAEKSDLAQLRTNWQQNIKRYQNNFRESVLVPGFPSLTVHYLWCANGHFEMSHYITILSALHQFIPDKMVIHYLMKPRNDPHGYWRWLEDLERDVVTLVLKPLQNSRHCSHELSAGVGDDDFPDAHGVFLLGDVAITNLTRPDIIRLMAESFPGKTVHSVKANDVVDSKWRNSQLFIVSNSEPYHVSQSPGRAVLACTTVSDFDNAINLINEPCVSMQSYFYFEELLNRETRFFRFARKLLYGSTDPIHLQGRKGSRIPNIYHIILNDKSPELTPLHYMSIKSAFKKGKIDTVYIHCSEKPAGVLWDRLIYTDSFEPIFVPTGSFLQSGKQYASMSYMLYTLLLHGGVASSGDIIFVKPVSSGSADAIVSLHRSEYRQKHRTINTAVLAAVPGSEFIHRLLGMIHQSENSWPSMKPDDIATHLSEVDPRSVYIDSQLISHHDCDGDHCKVAGGHDPPQMVHIIRMIWNNREPKSLDELLNVNGLFLKEILLK